MQFIPHDHRFLPGSRRKLFDRPVVFAPGQHQTAGSIYESTLSFLVKARDRIIRCRALRPIAGYQDQTVRQESAQLDSLAWPRGLDDGSDRRIARFTPYGSPHSATRPAMAS